MISAGTKLGSYEILSPLGAGGMGEVYRARDGKLNREVAIKVLPEAVAEDAERLARFQREAQVLASLNHPHIAAIYGLEKTGNVEALVLELVEGETLAERIGAGADSGGRGPRDRSPDRGRTRGRAREGHRAPGPEAGQREDHAGGQGQGPRLRPGESAHRGPIVARSDSLTDADSSGDDRPASSSGRRRTCRPSRRGARSWTSGPTSGRSARSCTRCSPGARRSRARPCRTRSPRC